MSNAADRSNEEREVKRSEDNGRRRKGDREIRTRCEKSEEKENNFFVVGRN